MNRFLSFDRVANEYDATRFLPETVREAVVEQMLNAIPFCPDDWFIDAGVGTGRFALPIARRGVRVLGIDVSRSMMCQLLRKHPPPNLHLAQADLRRLPLRSQTVRAVLIAHVLHLIADWQDVLRECRRVLHRDGVLFLLYEEGKRFPAREYYLARAREKGLLPPPLGAHSAAEAVQFVQGLGGVVTMIEHPSLHWIARRTHEEVLLELERRTYSQLWDVPDDVHRALLEQARRFVRHQFGSEGDTYTTEAVVKLYAVQFNN